MSTKPIHWFIQKAKSSNQPLGQTSALDSCAAVYTAHAPTTGKHGFEWVEVVPRAEVDRLVTALDRLLDGIATQFERGSDVIGYAVTERNRWKK